MSKIAPNMTFDTTFECKKKCNLISLTRMGRLANILGQFSIFLLENSLLLSLKCEQVYQVWRTINKWELKTKDPFSLRICHYGPPSEKVFKNCVHFSADLISILTHLQWDLPWIYHAFKLYNTCVTLFHLESLSFAIALHLNKRTIFFHWPQIKIL